MFIKSIRVKLGIALLSIALLVLPMGIGFLEGIPYEAVLCSGEWSGDLGSVLTFSDDGTGHLTSTGVDTDITWTLNGLELTIGYEFFGHQEATFTIGVYEGKFALATGENLAAYLGPDVISGGSSTPAPAAAEPTEEPTEAPTEIPTEVPTEAPTEVPTTAPATEPTAEPTGVQEAVLHPFSEYGVTVFPEDGLFLETCYLYVDDLTVENSIASNGTGEGECEVRTPDGEGNVYILATARFENLRDVEVDIRNIYGEFFFDDASEGFKMDLAPIREDAEKFDYFVQPSGAAAEEDGVIPDPEKETVVLLFATIPETLADSYMSCVLKLGFTDEFDYKMAVYGGYQYERLDDVFYMYLADDPLREFEDRDTIRALQTALNEAGFHCGTPDGVAGRNTAAAITDYQASVGLTQTGTATFETLNSLDVAPQVSY